jgi:hypothetical protein
MFAHRIDDGLALPMVSAVGLTLLGLGSVGAAFAAMQLSAWLYFGTLPVLAPVWLQTGLAGEVYAGFFAALPALLAGGLLFHAFVAFLGLGLYRRRPWARPAGLALAAVWALSAVACWAFAQHVLEDLARQSVALASFATGARWLATQVALLSLAVAVALLVLLMQPAVRRAFRPQL